MTLVDRTNTLTTSDWRVLIGICTYNEANNVVSMLQALRDQMPAADLLVVDDDSPDGTGRLAQQWAAHNGNCIVNIRVGQRGLGGAIRAAMVWAVEHDYDWFVNLDADHSHDPAALPEMFDHLADSGDADVLIGSRYIPGGNIVGWPWYRRCISRCVNALARHWLGLKIRDCSGSMRIYRVDMLRRINLGTLRNNGYALLEELLLRLSDHGAVMVEHPICFVDRAAGNSKLTLGEALSSAVAIARLK